MPERAPASAWKFDLLCLRWEFQSRIARVLSLTDDRSNDRKTLEADHGNNRAFGTLKSEYSHRITPIYRRRKPLWGIPARKVLKSLVFGDAPQALPKRSRLGTRYQASFRATTLREWLLLGRGFGGRGGVAEQSGDVLVEALGHFHAIAGLRPWVEIGSPILTVTLPLRRWMDPMGSSWRMPTMAMGTAGTPALMAM